MWKKPFRFFSFFSHPNKRNDGVDFLIEDKSTVGFLQTKGQLCIAQFRAQLTVFGAKFSSNSVFLNLKLLIDSIIFARTVDFNFELMFS